MRRQPSALGAQRHDELRERIRALTAEHPFWGARRIWAALRFSEEPGDP
jgi:putative transposase